MATSGNPLLDMTEAMTGHLGDEEVPDESFAETALPGFKKAVMSRRSIRVFDGEPIPEEVMRDCLRDAMLAPTSSNLQPFELYWVRDPKAREGLAEACFGQPAAATVFRSSPTQRRQWWTHLRVP